MDVPSWVYNGILELVPDGGRREVAFDEFVVADRGLQTGGRWRSRMRGGKLPGIDWVIDMGEGRTEVQYSI